MDKIKTPTTSLASRHTYVNICCVWETVVGISYNVCVNGILHCSTRHPFIWQWCRISMKQWKHCLPLEPIQILSLSKEICRYIWLCQLLIMSASQNYYVTTAAGTATLPTIMVSHKDIRFHLFMLYFTHEVEKWDLNQTELA